MAIAQDTDIIVIITIIRQVAMAMDLAMAMVNVIKKRKMKNSFRLFIVMLLSLAAPKAMAQMEFCGKFKISIDTDQNEKLETTMADCWTFEVFDDNDFRDIEYRQKAGVVIKFAGKADLTFFVEKLLEYGKAKKKELSPLVYSIKEKDDEWKSTRIKVDQFDRLLHFTVTKYPINGDGVVTSTTLLNLNNLKQILKELR